MSSDIMNTTVVTLDHLEFVDWSSGINPILLLDGHGSQI